MSSPQEVAARVWGGKPKDYRVVIPEDEYQEGFKAGQEAERLQSRKDTAKMLKDILEATKDSPEGLWVALKATLKVLEEIKEPEKEAKVKE